jgi:hypothetical protein
MLQPETAVLFLCDIQDGFRNVIYRAETVINKSLVMKNAANIMVILLVYIQRNLLYK